jgi:hypothetical protein
MSVVQGGVMKAFLFLVLSDPYREALSIGLEMPVIPDTFEYRPPDPWDVINLKTKEIVYYPSHGVYVIDVVLDDREGWIQDDVVRFLHEFGWKDWEDSNLTG